MGKMVMILGAVLFLIGACMYFGGHFLPLGKLPGDISFTKGNTTFYFPLGTSILLPVVLTLVLQLFTRR